MVCIPCFIVPVLLYLWHKFVQPYVLRYWNPWAVTDAEGNTKTEFPFNCEGGVCAFRRKQVDKELKQEVDQSVETSQENDHLKAE